MQDPRLKLDDIFANTANRLQKLLVTSGVSRSELIGTDSHRLQTQAFTIEFRRVIQNGRKTSLTDIGADPLNDLSRCQRLAKQCHRPLAACLRNDITLRAQFSS